ncbi:MAG: methyltransferase domain-containing protein [Gammaproteobacteria bacterium]|nr:methyltransferase domain-containing protein [Gammaproteobacteria bacterium]
MDLKAKSKWNSIYSDAEIKNQNVSKGLLENSHLLPASGRGLDLACGTGGDAIFLASKGFDVDAWDISDTVTEKLNYYAAENKLSINAEARDINLNPPSNASYDVITVAHFLERSLAPVLIAALKPGGLLFYQTFTREVTLSYSGPSNPDFRLGENELLSLFNGLKIIVYREEGLLGDIKAGFRNEALLIAQKPV